jgi:hypothetical protein
MNESILQSKLDKLFDEWEVAAAACPEIPAEIKECFVRDGFYPGYLNQKCKVLFVARESLSVEGDYIKEVFDAYKSKRIGGKNINQYQFHALMMYIAYALNNNCFDWNSIPWAEKLCETFGTPDGLSFAFMNLSKFSNWSESNWQSNWNLINSSLKVSGNDSFIKQEIELLDPDVIITMNLDGNLSYLGEMRKVLNTTDINKYAYKVNGKEIPLYDMWHFSAPSKSPRGNYLEPLSKLV